MKSYCWLWGHSWGTWQDYLLDENDGLKWSPEVWAIYIDPEYRSFRKCLKCDRVQDRILTDPDRREQVDRDNGL